MSGIGTKGRFVYFLLGEAGRARLEHDTIMESGVRTMKEGGR